MPGIADEIMATLPPGAQGPSPGGMGPTDMPMPQKGGGTNWLSLLPALIGTAAGAFGGPDSAMGQGGLGFTNAYVGALMKKQEEDRQQKAAFENLMLKTAWENFQNLDGVDLGQIDTDPSLRSRMMQLSDAWKNSIANNKIPTPKEVMEMNALYSGIAEPVRQLKERRQAESAQRASAGAEVAGVREQMMQAYPGQDAATREGIWASHPDIAPALNEIGGGEAQLGPIGQGNSFWREQAAQDTLRSRRSNEMMKGRMFPVQRADGSVVYAPAGSILSSDAQGAARKQRADIAEANRVAAMERLRTRLKAAAERRGQGLFAPQDAGAVNKWLDDVTREAVDKAAGDDEQAFQESLSRVISGRPFVMRNGTIIPGEELYGNLTSGNPNAMTQPPMAMGAPSGQPYTVQELQELKAAQDAGRPLSPRQQEIITMLRQKHAGDVRDAK